jgi:Flp pilus assembly protein TadB
MEEQRKSFLSDWQIQLLLLLAALFISYFLFNWHIPPAPSDVTGISVLPYILSNTPIAILVVIIILDGLMNACLYVLIQKWRALPRNKRAYEKQLAKKHERQQAAEMAEKEKAQTAKKEGFKTLKEYDNYLDRKNSPGIMGWIGIVFGLLCLGYIVGIFLTWMGGVIVFVVLLIILIKKYSKKEVEKLKKANTTKEE